MSYSISPPALYEYGLLDATLRERGFSVLPSEGVCALAAIGIGTLNSWKAYWDDLPLDTYLRDGGRYRRRRHSCFVVQGDTVTQVPHRAHWQPLDYNALHGGMHRHFEPMQDALLQQPEWTQLLQWLAKVCSQLKGPQTWYVEAHQFRIDTSDGIGRPTPEGAHRDGVDLVAVFLVGRHALKGGETRVFDAAGPNGQRFTLAQSWSVLLLDDARVVHESTPIQPLAPDAHRDTLVITLRSKGFQDDFVSD